MVFPTMTAICQDSRELGRQAYELLANADASQSGEPKPSVVGTAWLEINHTTGRVPGRLTRVLPSGQRLETAANYA
jgi:hypothetical protein